MIQLIRIPNTTEISLLLVRLIAGATGLCIGLATTQIWLNHRFFVIGLILPQVIGILAYLPMSILRVRFARAVGTLLPPVWFVLVSMRFLFAPPPESECGMMALAIIYIAVAGIILHALVGFFVQIGILSFKRSFAASA